MATTEIYTTHNTLSLHDALPIPPEHYKAVAEVIGFVMKLRRTGLRAN